MMRLIAGNKLITAAVVALGVGLISYFVIQYIQQGERDKVTIELQEKTNETRQKIRGAVNEGVGSTSPNDDASESLRYLKSRKGDD